MAGGHRRYRGQAPAGGERTAGHTEHTHGAQALWRRCLTRGGAALAAAALAAALLAAALLATAHACRHGTPPPPVSLSWVKLWALRNQKLGR